MPTRQAWTVLVLFGFLAVPTASWAQRGTATKTWFVGGSGDLTSGTAARGALGGTWLDEPIAAEVSLSAPHGFGTMPWVQSRETMPSSMTMELGREWFALDLMEPSGDLLTIHQLQPTKLKKISRKKAIIIAAVVVPIAVLVFYQIGLKGGGY